MGGLHASISKEKKPLPHQKDGVAKVLLPHLENQKVTHMHAVLETLKTLRVGGFDIFCILKLSIK